MQTIYLDISNKGVYPCINAKQGEVGRKFAAIITDNGVPYNIASAALLSVWYSSDKDEGNYSTINNKSAFNVVDNSVSVELIPQMLANPGRGKLCFSISYPDGSQVSSWNIEYDVEEVPGIGSAPPDEYYTAFAAEIAALKRLMQSGKNTNPKNLLDNSNFADPINQRLLTSYTGGTYGIDRWKNTMGAAFTVSIGDGKINLVNTGATGYYMQVLPRDLSGEVVTLVAKTSEGIVSKSCIVSDEDSTERIGSLGASIFVSSQGDTTNCGIYFDTYSAVSLDLYWIALYIGEYEAAALPDYIPKSHSEEFLECSRYATSVGRYQTLPSFITSSQKEVWATVFLPVTMVSATPSAETTPKVVIRHTDGYSLLTPDSASSVTPKEVSCTAENVQNSNIMRIRMSFDGALGVNNVPASVFIDKGFLISADL